MKYVIIDKMIISLENILTVKFKTFGNYYYIVFVYTDGKEFCTEFSKKKEVVQKWFKRICEKLSENA
jgi:hypothetical protein